MKTPIHRMGVFSRAMGRLNWYTDTCMKILLIRHGETTGDIEDRYGGSYDDDLTEKGRQQLQQTAEQLAGRKVDVIFASTLKRAQQSAEIINAELQTTIEPMDGLRERDYGVLGGLTKQEARERYPDAVEAHKDPANTDPEGESLAEFTDRVIDAFKTITAQDYKTVAIVSHGGPLKTILRHLAQPVPDSIGDGEIIEIDLDHIKHE
jgi:broad specificity phosphatase PhoE